MLFRLPLSLIACCLPLIFADVEFTYPPAGAQIPVSDGAINVQWKNAARAPPISSFTQYTLDLMVGGNDANDMRVVTPFKAGGLFANGNNITGQIAAGLSGPLPNGFFFRIQSQAATGGNVINFSSRFTITGLTGSVDNEYVKAVEQLNGNTSPPPREGNALPSNSSSSSVVAGSSTAHFQTVTVTSPTAGGTGHPASTIPDSGPSNNNNSMLVGAGVGIAVFVTAVIAVGVWLLMRRKQQQRRAADWDDKDVLAKKQPSVSVTTLSELSSEGREVFVEAGDGLPPPEMDSNQIRAELPGDYVYEGSELGTPTGDIADMFLPPLTPIASSINGEETLPMSPLGKI